MICLNVGADLQVGPPLSLYRKVPV
jgi:hypothetical protein